MGFIWPKELDFSEFWGAPYRPLFLASFLCALVSLAWWPLGVRLGLPVPGLQPSVLWHVHELIFGFVAAAIGGYVLTALPGWTSAPPLSGSLLKMLVLIWIVARGATGLAETLPIFVPFVVNSMYFVALAGVISYQVFMAKTYRKLWFVVAILALGIGETLFLKEALTGNVVTSLLIAQTMLVCILVLVSAVAMRAIPAFTNNWLIHSGDAEIRQAPFLRLGVIGLFGLALALRLFGLFDASYCALLLASIAMFGAMSGWKSRAVLSNPLLTAQHLAFLWAPIGAMLVGLSGLRIISYPVSDAIHALTIGAMSGLIMAIAGRAGAHTKDGGMRASFGFVVGVLAIWLTTWVRLVAPLAPNYATDIHVAAALLWCVGWIAFIIGFVPALSGPVRRPVLSGHKYQVSLAND